MINKNPFILNDYYKPKYFCNRNKETDFIIKKIGKIEKVMLVSRKGIGKTTLIKNVYYELSKNKDLNLIYINLIKTTSLSQFIIHFYFAVLEAFGTKSKKKTKKLKIIISNKPDDDQLAFLTKLTEEQLILKFTQILAFLNSQKKQAVITLENYNVGILCPFNLFEDIIIKPLVLNSNINLILSGTKNILSFKHDEIIALDKIPAEIYQKFILSQFKNSRKSISLETIDKILAWSKYDTYTVQLVCNRLWQTHKKKLKNNSADLIFAQIMAEYSNIFTKFEYLLSEYQWKLLNAISAEGKAEQVTSAGFMKKYELNAPSSVKTALTALEGKEMIFRENNSYQVSNVIFGHWLALH